METVNPRSHSMTQEITQVEVQRDRCPFCHDAVSPDQAKTACDACMAWHHKDCWADHGGCSACGEGASTAVKPSPKESPAPQQEGAQEAVQAPQRTRTTLPTGTTPRPWLAVSGLIISLITALGGSSLLAAVYSPTETSSGIWALNFKTPQGFDPIGVTFILFLTVPLLLLGAGLSAGGRARGNPRYANAGLVISALYALVLFGASASAFG